ncbi:hypothetical protein [Paraburkholderia tropica]|uniref:hypothetical protein n=1 Tax=Paraburkholderia tropica TaxID=92647 RepID=UPI001F337D6F|nr:hypothetical protein [Paraburkholderia tropica]
MTQQIRDIWKRFDELIGKTENDDTKLIIEALKAQAELINHRLAPLPAEIAALVQKALPKQ